MGAAAWARGVNRAALASLEAVKVAVRVARSQRLEVMALRLEE